MANKNDYSDILHDDAETCALLRHPIFIGNSLFVITSFSNNNSLGLGQLFTEDYICHHKEINRAAKDLVEQIKDYCSISFWWALKEAIDRQIEQRNEQNKELGYKQFKFNRSLEKENNKWLVNSYKSALKLLKVGRKSVTSCGIAKLVN